MAQRALAPLLVIIRSNKKKMKEPKKSFW